MSFDCATHLLDDLSFLSMPIFIGWPDVRMVENETNAVYASASDESWVPVEPATAVGGNGGRTFPGHQCRVLSLYSTFVRTRVVLNSQCAL